MRAAFALVLAPVGLIAALAWAQSAPRAPRVPFSGGMMTAPGFVTDGGISSASIQSGSATVTGKTSTGSLEVMGAADFRGTRPTGIFLAANLVRSTGLLISTLNQWVSVGTVAGSGALAGDACDLTAWPASLAILSVDYRCFVTPTGVVDVQIKAAVGLTVPAGTYKTVISGPVPTP